MNTFNMTEKMMKIRTINTSTYKRQLRQMMMKDNHPRHGREVCKIQ